MCVPDSLIAVITASIERKPFPHLFNSDGVCVKCGFDGADWRWWKHSTYEGRASHAKQPMCEQREATFEEAAQAEFNNYDSE